MIKNYLLTSTWGLPPLSLPPMNSGHPASIYVSVSHVLRDRRKLSLKTDSGYAGPTLSAKSVIRGMFVLSFACTTAKTFGKSKTVSLFFLLFIYKEKCCDNGCNGSLFAGRKICYAMFTRARTAHLDRCFFMQTINNYWTRLSEIS